MNVPATVRENRQRPHSSVATYAMAAASVMIGIGIAAVSVTINYSYGIARGETWAALAVLAALGATIVPGCIPSLPHHARRSAYLALALCLAVSGLNALGAASSTRTTATVVADDASGMRTRTRDTYARAERELTTIASRAPGGRTRSGDRPVAVQPPRSCE